GRLQSQDSGKHLHDVEDLLQTHNLVEADTSAQAERIKAVQASAQRFTSDGQSEVIHTHTHTYTHTPTPPHILSESLITVSSLISISHWLSVHQYQSGPSSSCLYV